MLREILLSLSVVLLLSSAAAVAQPASGTIPRIAFLSANAPSDTPALREAFLAGLREANYIEGKSIFIDWRFAGGNPERLASLAKEVVALKPALIVAEATPAVRAAKQVTSTIPIVMTAVADAVGSGLVGSLARPGANITGMSFLGTELVGKRLELLKQALPGIVHVTVLQHVGVHGEATATRMREETERAAQGIKLNVRVVQAKTSADLAPLFATLAKARTDALLVWPSPMFLGERKQLAHLALKNKLPAMYYLREFVDAGGLMAYGPSLPDLFRRSAIFVDKILKGAKPGDLPVEQPSRFEFIINQTAASDLGIKIPEGLLVRADEVLRY
jgi:putative ABC transport system substrate-binding protein